jgi:hypothetical protein
MVGCVRFAGPTTYTNGPPTGTGFMISGFTVIMADRAPPAYFAVMIVDPVTVPAVIVIFPVVPPAWMVTTLFGGGGTEAMLELSLEKVIWAPPEGAGPLSVTRPVVESLTRMNDGLMTSCPVRTAGATVKVAASVTPPAEAVIVAWPARLAAA